MTLASRLVSRSDPALGFSSWLEMLSFNGNSYPFSPSYSLAFKQEQMSGDFSSLGSRAYKGNSVVFSCMERRRSVFSEARFQFRTQRAGRPGKLYGNPDLAILETPWPNGTTGDLLSRAIQDVDLAGNFYARRVGQVLQRMRPDWVQIVLGSKSDPDQAGWQLDAEILGYLHFPGGPYSGDEPDVLLREEVAHWAPIPDPHARYRGMSWLTPLINEIMADSAATTHKLKFFENGATPNLFVSLKEPNADAFERWKKLFKDQVEGLDKAYKTLFLGGGADVKVIGADMQQLDFKITQGAGETRIAAAAGAPPIIVGLSEGLQAATYSNYGQARRAFADVTIRPLWRNFAGSMATVVNVPPAAELWYDDRDIPFLREDQKDRADGQRWAAMAIHMLVAAGYDADSVVQAIDSGDLTLLKHTGMVSVQLMPPGTGANGDSGTDAAGMPRALAPFLNGNGDG